MKMSLQVINWGVAVQMEISKAFDNNVCVYGPLPVLLDMLILTSCSLGQL